MKGLSTAERRAIDVWYLNLPHHGIPEDRLHAIQSVANGITMPLWGRPALPNQIRYLHDNDLTEPAQIHAAFGELDHPHAPGVKVKDYSNYVHAFQEHQKANAK